MLLGVAVRLRTFPTIERAGTQPAVTFRTLPTAALVLEDVGFDRGGRHIIGTLSLRVEREHRWLVLGPNGSGKTTLLRIAALYEHPSRGTVEVLGERLGRTDVRTLRRRIGYASSALAAQLRADLSALDVVKTAKYAALEPWWHRYDVADATRATQCLLRLGVGRPRGTHVRYVVVGGATARPAGAHTDERPGGGAPRRAGRASRHRRS